MALLRANGSVVTAVRDVQGRYILREVRTVTRYEAPKARSNDVRYKTENDKVIELRDRVNKQRDRINKLKTLLG
jgi:hypothetical protein